MMKGSLDTICIDVDECAEACFTVFSLFVNRYCKTPNFSSHHFARQRPALTQKVRKENFRIKIDKSIVGSFRCGGCPAGFQKDINGCKDIDECLSDNGGCAPGVECINTYGSSRCGPCPTGRLTDHIIVSGSLL